MAIKVEKEPEEVIRLWGDMIENCVFCSKHTRYWHTRTNNPVCQECGPKHKVSELRDWRKAVREKEYRERKKQEQKNEK